MFTARVSAPVNIRLLPTQTNMLSIRRLTVQLGLLEACAYALNIIPACTSSIYCTGKLLQTVQLARIYQDSKTFVDKKMVRTEAETLADFSVMMNQNNDRPSRKQIELFINDHFEEGKELMHWSPPDFNPNPPILQKIADPKLREFAKQIIGLWEKLGRKVNKDVAKNPDRYSFLYVPNGFVVPGGRFKEIYYWDSFWVVRGLLISNMTETARGMIENLLYLVDTIGYVPNGSRDYYLGRSQPPLLAAMVASYFYATNDIAWLNKHILTVEKELHYWLKKKMIVVDVKGKKYYMLRYISDKTNGPRPESYYEDYEHARVLDDEEAREDFYREMKSAAESGWDFSTRWFITGDKEAKGNLTDIHITCIIPVDLNAIFAGALELAGHFRKELNHQTKAHMWFDLAKHWRRAIHQVLWDDADGVWYDYDVHAGAPRRAFYPSCVTPLWASAIESYKAPKFASRLVTYLLSTGALDFPGGVPASLINSSQQWDYPNAWPPSQSILINALDTSGYQEAKILAKEQAQLWIKSNYIGFTKYQKMFEKYNVVQPGDHGNGGEYNVQDGFGWTNGVALELLHRYGEEMYLDDENLSPPYPVT